MIAGVVAADPEALRAIRRVGANASWELTRTGRRLALALASADGDEVPAWARSLGDEIAALAEQWEALDSWVGRVGDAVAGADVVGLAPAAGPGRTVAAGSVAAFVDATPTWVDGLTDEEAEAAVLAAARQLRPFAPFLMGSQRSAVREQLAALVRRVRRRWPDEVIRNPASDARCAPRRVMPKGLDDAIELLRLPGEGRRLRTAGIFEAALTGFTAGAATKGYETPGAETARTSGQVLSGILVFGDARDGVVEATRGNWWGVAASAAGAIPGAGDAFKGAKALDDVVDTAGDLRRLDPLFRYPTSGADLRTLLRTDLVPGGGLHIHEWLDGHTISKHVNRSDEQLAQRLVDEPVRKRVSTFLDRVEAEAAVSYAMNELRPQIQAMVERGYGEIGEFVPVPAGIGRVLARGADTPTAGNGVTIVIRAASESPFGYKLITAYPEVR